MSLIRKWLSIVVAIFMIGSLTAEQCVALMTSDLDDETIVLEEEASQEERASVWENLLEGGTDTNEFPSECTTWKNEASPCECVFPRVKIRCQSKIHTKEARVSLASKVSHRAYYLLYHDFKFHIAAH